MYRGSSVIGQAPLDGLRTPSSPLSFKRWLVVLWRIVSLLNYLSLRLKHNGVSNPSLSLSCRVLVSIKATLVAFFNVSYSVLQHD